MQETRVQKVKIWPSYELFCFDTNFSNISDFFLQKSIKSTILDQGPSSFGFYKKLYVFIRRYHKKQQNQQLKIISGVGSAEIMPSKVGLSQVIWHQRARDWYIFRGMNTDLLAGDKHKFDTWQIHMQLYIYTRISGHTIILSFMLCNLT